MMMRSALSTTYLAGSAEVDNISGCGGGIGEGVDVSHNIMSRRLSPLLGIDEIDIIERFFHLCEGLRRDTNEAKLALAAREVQAITDAKG